MGIIYTFIIISIIGTLLHFTYKWSGNKIWVAIFSSVNESVWEHIKIMLTPIFLIETIKYVMQDQNNYFIRLFLMLITAIFLITAFESLIYRYVRKNKAIYHIISFYITAFIVSLIEYHLKNINPLYSLNKMSMFLCLIIFIMYLTFTIFPPRYKIFEDPNTHNYGIPNM